MLPEAGLRCSVPVTLVIDCVESAVTEMLSWTWGTPSFTTTSGDAAWNGFTAWSCWLNICLRYYDQKRFNWSEGPQLWASIPVKALRLLPGAAEVVPLFTAHRAAPGRLSDAHTSIWISVVFKSLFVQNQWYSSRLVASTEKQLWNVF